VKKYLVILTIIFLAVIGAIFIAFNSTTNNQNNDASQQSGQHENISNEIMYFYAENCHWCQKQKPIVEELEKEGIKFKKMDVGENRTLLNQYNIEGTPTFILKDKRLTGFQSKEKIKNLWEGKE